MATFLIEDNQSLIGKDYKIPDYLNKHLNGTLASLGDYKQTSGYKKLNGIINPNYNKRNKKNEKAGFISYGNMKKFKHDYETLSDKNSIEAKLMGGDKMYQWVNSELSRKRNEVAPVNAVKKSANISKSKLNTVKVNKPIKPNNIKNASITIEKTIKANRKKIYITESQLKRIIEKRNELYIPFNGKSGLHDKPCYAHFMDWIEENGKIGTLTNDDNKTIYDYFDKSINETMWNNFEITEASYELYCNYFLNKFPPKDNQNLYDENFLEDIEENNYDGFFDIFGGEGDLSDEGKKIFLDEIPDYFKENSDIDFIDRVNVSEKGLVLVYRALDIPNFSKDTTGEFLDSDKDYFEYLNEKYGNEIGQFWAYSTKGADDYNAFSLGKNDETIVLYGLVKPSSIDWDRSVGMKLDYAEEEELTINKNEPIEIYGFQYASPKDGNDKFYRFKNSYIMNA
jgi:hypothetical protein